MLKQERSELPFVLKKFVKKRTACFCPNMFDMGYLAQEKQYTLFKRKGNSLLCVVFLFFNSCHNYDSSRRFLLVVAG